MAFIWLLHELVLEILILTILKFHFSTYVSDELFLDYVYIELSLIYDLHWTSDELLMQCYLNRKCQERIIHSQELQSSMLFSS